MRYAQVAITASPLRNGDLLFNLSRRGVFQPALGHLQSGKTPSAAPSLILIFLLVFLCRAKVLRHLLSLKLSGAVGWCVLLKRYAGAVMYPLIS